MAPPSTRWQLQTAKNQFSKLVERAVEQGPQVVTRRGTDAVVVMAADEYAKLSQKRRSGLVNALLGAPRIKAGLPVERRGAY